jgi:aspartyl-tRNA(Asn)/glutamyl-tRNA(Gln) amidotransferase subunit A
VKGKTIKDLVLDVKKNQTSAMSLVSEAYQKIKKYDEYNSVISIMPEYALERAKDIDERLKKGEDVGSLAGIPFLAKDNFLTIKGKTTAASNFLDSFEAPLQASAIEKLEAEGAICIGKTNLDAFAHGSSTENSVFGVTKNSKDKGRVAGGSSGGSAVAVALDIVPFALGTDTGGSIRQPSSFNGVAGLKPTYGAVSRFGVLAMASSTDCIGPIAKNCQDVELIMSVISGQDERDGTTLSDFYKTIDKSEKLKVGIIKDCLNDTVDKNVSKTVYDYAEKLKQLGHTVEEVSLPMTKYAVAMYYVIVPAEISSNLARYDGVRYGRRAESSSLDDLYGKSRDQGFARENKRRILIGSYVLSSGYFDAYYNKAQKARTLLINEYRELFKDYDVLLSPTAPTPAFKIGELAKDAVKMYMADAMTVPPSLAGLPALSVPFGQTESGLPIGVQLIGSYQSDAKLLALGRETEKING